MESNYYIAPMEGITGSTYRRAHWEYYPHADKYIAPFLSPTQDHLFTLRDRREILPERNEGIPVVPQLMTRNSDDFLWAARELRDMGYEEVNLNLGCPSGTVVAKGKGSGLLGRLELLDELLYNIFSAELGIRVSVKTRLGLEQPEEFERILAIYQRYPISELTIHPRVRRDQYKGAVRLEEYGKALQCCSIPVCYNGDLLTPDNVAALLKRFPETKALMLGRGVIADPALIGRLRGGPGTDKEQLAGFTQTLYEGYCVDFGHRHGAMQRLKEVWSYLLYLFADRESYGKKLRKTTDPAQYERVAAELIRDLDLLPEPELPWRGVTVF